MNNTEIWLERLTSLYKSQMRQTVSDEGIPLVHFEILQYLAICNRYSNTAQAVTEYLGQTKGSISQSLKVMIRIGHVKREACQHDKRVMRLHLTEEGEACRKRLLKKMSLETDENHQIIASIKTLLESWQKKTEQQCFGLCKSCRFNLKLKNNKFQCKLTNEILSKKETNLICREHEFAIGQ